MRASLSAALVRLATEDPRVVLLTGDHGYALFDEFRKDCAGQYFNAGIAEQNMVGVAAGLARAGFRPIVYGLAAFVPIRVLEQIKIDICHDNLSVLLLGDGAGIVYSALGTSHQSCEDIAVTRALPHLTILSPADRFELSACMDFSATHAGPIYMRVGKADLGDIHQVPVVLKPSELMPVTQKKGHIAFIATGSMVKTAIELVGQFPDASIWSAPCIKPLGSQQIIEIARQHDVIVTMEEHSVYGGLGSVVAEIISAVAPRRILRIGVEDRFSVHCGSYAYLRSEHKLDVESIAQRVKAFIDTTNGCE